MELYSIDTSCWIPFFRGKKGPVTDKVRSLLQDSEVDIGVDGIVLAELLQGVKTKKERSQLQHYLSGLPLLKTKKDIYIKAGKMNAALRRKGISVPITDAIITATALTYGAVVITIDEHFTHFAGLNYELINQ